MWLRNCWYVIAWDHEIPGAGAPELFRRVVLNEPLLVYRTAAGEVIALEDRCVHRHAPLSLHSCQTLTPETETSTHYFFQQSHPVGEGDEAAAESIYASLVQAFNEDRDMIGAQHANIAHDPGRPMLPLAIDSALVQFRRALAERMEIERATVRA